MTLQLPNRWLSRKTDHRWNAARYPQVCLDMTCVFASGFFGGTTTVTTRLIAFPVTICCRVHHLYGSGCLMIIHHHASIRCVILGRRRVKPEKLSYVECFLPAHASLYEHVIKHATNQSPSSFNFFVSVNMRCSNIRMMSCHLFVLGSGCFSLICSTASSNTTIRAQMRSALRFISNYSVYFSPSSVDT